MKLPAPMHHAGLQPACNSGAGQKRTYAWSSGSCTGATAEGKPNRRIADALDIAVKTVDTHRTRLMKKLDIHDQTSLVKFAIRKGIIRVHSPRSIHKASRPR